MTDPAMKKLVNQFARVAREGENVIPLELTEGLKFSFLVCNLDDPWRGGEFIFEVSLRGYPEKAPVIRCLTENGLFAVGAAICIHGITAFHGNEWVRGTKLSLITRNVASQMVVMDEMRGAVGVVDTSPEYKAAASERSREFNARTNGGLSKILDEFVGANPKNVAVTRLERIRSGMSVDAANDPSTGDSAGGAAADATND